MDATFKKSERQADNENLAQTFKEDLQVLDIKREEFKKVGANRTC